MWLLRRANQVDPDCLVAQRLKRLPSILQKLRRFPEMKFSQMQDIAGCRAIVASVPHVDRLVDIYKKSDLKHKLIHEDDYIRFPKESGYRGIHLVYRYYSDRSTTYNDLKVEVQLRSLYQHAWATAVETVGIFTRQALKSSQGQQDWLRFFQLMGTAIALREKTPTIPNTPTIRKDLEVALREYEKLLNVENHLRLYTEALQAPERAGDVQDAHYFLLELDTVARKLKVTGYKNDELQKASDDYLKVEQKALSDGSKDAVLVSVDSFNALKRAFPNYYLDTHRFIQLVKHEIGQRRESTHGQQSLPFN